eukprot:scaffold80865_cov55-Attheya_sp.AAC.8
MLRSCLQFRTVVVMATVVSGLGLPACTMVPERMMLSKSMQESNLSDAKMVKLKTANMVEELNELSSSAMISEHTGKFGSVCFVVRRPGLCREEGLALEKVAAQEDTPFDGFGLFGVVKETGVDDEGLVDFNTKYFKRTLYLDTDLVFYNALGGRKLSVPSWNPLKFISTIKAIGTRAKEKGISQNLKGEGIVQGGVIIFGKDGAPKYVYEEDTWNEMPVDDIIAAVNAVKAESN